MSAINFLFRKPRLPIIVDTGTRLIGAKSWAACERQLAAITFADMAPRDVIDATAEAFFPVSRAHGHLAPDIQKAGDKDGFIELYNGQKGLGRPESSKRAPRNSAVNQTTTSILCANPR